MKKKNSDSKDNLRCSFCGKNQDEVKKLIAGPTVLICDECVELCNDIIEEEWEELQHGRPSPRAGLDAAKRAVHSRCLRSVRWPYRATAAHREPTAGQYGRSAGRPRGRMAATATAPAYLGSVSRRATARPVDGEVGVWVSHAAAARFEVVGAMP